MQYSCEKLTQLYKLGVERVHVKWLNCTCIKVLWLNSEKPKCLLSPTWCTSLFSTVVLLSWDFWAGWTHVIGKELNSHFWIQERILTSYESKDSVQLIKKIKQKPPTKTFNMHEDIHISFLNHEGIQQWLSLVHCRVFWIKLLKCVFIFTSIWLFCI